MKLPITQATYHIGAAATTGGFCTTLQIQHFPIQYCGQSHCSDSVHHGQVIYLENYLELGYKKTEARRPPLFTTVPGGS
jgi:hypothetical protein